MMLSDLDIGIDRIKNIGQKKKEVFSNLEINTVEELLSYYPRNYQDRRDIKPIFYLSSDKLQTAKGSVVSFKEERFLKKNIYILKVRIFDGTGYLSLYFFGKNRLFIKRLKKILKLGRQIIVSGKVESDGREMRMSRFDYEVLEDAHGDLLHTNRIVPIYPLADKLKKYGGQRFIRQVIKYTLDTYLDKIKDPIPQEVLIKEDLLDLQQAIYNIHFPTNYTILKKAKERLIFDEFLLIQLAICILKRKLSKFKGISFNTDNNLLNKFLDSLPFKLTKEQLEVLDKIKERMRSSSPMRVLLHGEVASGKTILGCCAAVIAAAENFQVAFMAPTEILATQHYAYLTNMLKNIDIKSALLIGSVSKKEKKALLDKLSTGEIKLVVGTHALLQENIEFSNLGLCIIDELQRFGVEQRTALYRKAKSIIPDLLVMSATPIPRTLALTLYADLDILTLPALPRNNQKIITVCRAQKSLPNIYNFIKKKIKEESAQAYIVYPVVEEETRYNLRSAKKEFRYLKEEVFNDLNVGLLYASMRQSDQQAVLRGFMNKEIDILITTTISEVGLDVPSANIMLIMHSERFGLAQLHQLRGRISRCQSKAYCIAIVPDNIIKEVLSDDIDIDNLSMDDVALLQIKRLRAFMRYSDGFKISQVDLELRGPGEFLGIRQHGLPELKLAHILHHAHILKKTKLVAEYILSKYNSLNELPLLKNIVVQSLKNKIDFLIS